MSGIERKTSPDHKWGETVRIEFKQLINVHVDTWLNQLGVWIVLIFPYLTIANLVSVAGVNAALRAHVGRFLQGSSSPMNNLPHGWVNMIFSNPSVYNPSTVITVLTDQKILKWVRTDFRHKAFVALLLNASNGQPIVMRQIVQLGPANSDESGIREFASTIETRKAVHAIAAFCGWRSSTYKQLYITMKRYDILFEPTLREREEMKCDSEPPYMGVPVGDNTSMLKYACYEPIGYFYVCLVPNRHHRPRNNVRDVRRVKNKVREALRNNQPVPYTVHPLTALTPFT